MVEIDKEYKPFHCANCGYDGGRSHLEETAALEQKITVLENKNVDDAQTKQMRIWATAIVAGLFVLVGSYTSCEVTETYTKNMAPKPAVVNNKTVNEQKVMPPHPVAAAYKALGDSYKVCLDKAANNVELANGCNKTFRDTHAELKSQLDKESPK